MRRHWWRFIALMAAACGGSPTPTGDPCAPGGHVHRDPAGDWCHCDRGFRAPTMGLSCEVDPNFTGRTTIDLGTTDDRACWHAAQGPFVTGADGARVDQFLTHYTLALSGRGDGLRQASAVYRAAVTAPHVLTLSRGVNVSIFEVLPGGSTKEVPVLVTRATTACPQLGQQFGFELVSRGEYRFELGPSSQTEVGFVLDQVE
jgi:hypothetical protein